MVLNKILDQYLSSYQIYVKSIKGFGNNESKNFNVKLQVMHGVGGSTTALCECCSGELKIDGYPALMCFLTFLSGHGDRNQLLLTSVVQMGDYNRNLVAFIFHGHHWPMISKNFCSWLIEKLYFYIFTFTEVERKLAENTFLWVIYRLIWMIAIEKKIMKFDKTLKLVPGSRLK